ISAYLWPVGDLQQPPQGLHPPQMTAERVVVGVLQILRSQRCWDNQLEETTPVL
ncbi:Uncharacterized protein DAT39_010262, partial [Clarias magur]